MYEREEHLKAALLSLDVAAKLEAAMCARGSLRVPETNANSVAIQRLREEAASLAKKAVDS